MSNTESTSSAAAEVAAVAEQDDVSQRLDTNRDGRITALDALLVINQLSRQDPPSRAEGEQQLPENLDANGDGRVSTLDALVVINGLSPIGRDGDNRDAVFTNPVNPLDVNASGTVTADDADLVFEALERFGAAQVKDLPPGQVAYVDVNGDGRLSALDALAVINQLSESDDNHKRDITEPLSVNLVEYSITDE